MLLPGGDLCPWPTTEYPQVEKQSALPKTLVWPSVEVAFAEWPTRLASLNEEWPLIKKMIQEHNQKATEKEAAEEVSPVLALYAETEIASSRKRTTQVPKLSNK
jgi:hypothetical protein